jgi:hypothetical protein
MPTMPPEQAKSRSGRRQWQSAWNSRLVYPKRHRFHKFYTEWTITHSFERTASTSASIHTQGTANHQSAEFPCGRSPRTRGRSTGSHRLPYPRSCRNGDRSQCVPRKACYSSFTTGINYLLICRPKKFDGAAEFPCGPQRTVTRLRSSSSSSASCFTFAAQSPSPARFAAV